MFQQSKTVFFVPDNTNNKITEGIIMGEEAPGGEECNIGLSLGLGRGSDEFKPKGELSNRDNSRPHHPVQFHVLFPTPLHPKEEIVENEVIDLDRSSSKRVEENDENASNCKKQKTTTATSSTDNNMDNDNKYGCSSTTRKKLRLTKEQSTLLEDSFKQHNTLNQMQKHDLAQKLDLRPRQVEVWFQNRRARTKLKQTEVDYEFLKKCCESLSDENRRLKKELHELRSLKFGSPSPFYVHLPKSATLTMCPACEKVTKSNEDKGKGVIKTVKLVEGDGPGPDDSSTLALKEK